MTNTLLSLALLGLLAAAVAAAGWRQHVDAARAWHRVGQLEAQLDELRSRALGTPAPSPYAAPRFWEAMSRTRGPAATAPAPLPDVIEQALGGFEDPETRAEFEAAARAVLRERPAADPRAVLDEVFG